MVGELALTILIFGKENGPKIMEFPTRPMMISPSLGSFEILCTCQIQSGLNGSRI